MPQLIATRNDTDKQVHIQWSDQIHLDDGDVTIDVAFSAINYKDALALCNQAPILRRFPMVPGIDLAGTISASNHPAWPVGQAVVIAGRGIGERRSGGYTSQSRQPVDILTPLPANLTLYQAMTIGTAGITAALCVQAIQAHVPHPSTLPVLVTGASGGVGVHAVALLSRLGYPVTAVTGRPSMHDLLQRIGAQSVIGRDQIAGERALESERWAAVVDTVGGDVAAAAIRSTAYAGVVAMCGNAGGNQLPLNVFPFILRGVHIAGIDSVNAPQATIDAAWMFAAQHYDHARLAPCWSTIPLDEVQATAAALLAGQRYGRCIVAL
jgi:acrylyl-CoA reductase (NADPH)